MTEIYDIRGLPITVAFKPGLVSIVCDTHLWKLADRREQSDFRWLIRRMYQDHKDKFARPLCINERSFLTEIYGHIYADYYLLRYQRFFRYVLRKRLYERFLQSCEDIDCGDRSIDPNRWFWDMISILNPVIYPFYPRNISKKYAKKAQ